MVLLLIYQIPISINIFAIPLIVLLNLLLAIGVGLWFASLNVFYHDFTYALPFVIQTWMFASPLAYSSSIIPASWNWLYDLNPMVGVIDSFRWALFGSIDFPADSLFYSLVVGLVIFLGGMIIFRRLERSFADVI